MDHPTDIELLEKTLAGDMDSFGVLCSRYYSALTAIAYAVLHDAQLAEDAAQESFARALVRLDGLKNKKKFASWLASICRNEALDMHRRKGRLKNARCRLPDSGRDTGPCDTERVRNALKQLPPSAREILVLRYYDGLSYEQIGKVLGISKASINGRLTRSKRQIAEYLEQDDFPENKP